MCSCKRGHTRGSGSQTCVVLTGPRCRKLSRWSGARWGSLRIVRRQQEQRENQDRSPSWALPSKAGQGKQSAIGCCCLVTQSCPTLCDPMGCSPPGSSAHGILQARVLEGVARPFSRGSSRFRDGTPGLLHCRQILYGRATGGTSCNWPVGLIPSGSKVHGWSQMPGTWPWGD